jgi:tryptophan 2,3-dioxygenase
MSSPGNPLYYWDYLQLDRVLDAQRPESAKHGAAAHDEMLFIIIHQAFELWFKQILHELGRVLAIMGRDPVDEKEVGSAVLSLGRITEIQRLLIDQLAVLETMTPLDFLDFREHLVPASGFQSVQFRLVENRLGLRPRFRLKISGAAYTSVLSEEHVRMLKASEHEPSLADHTERWLERTPFLSFGTFDFWSAYRGAVEAMLATERRTIEAHPSLEPEEREAQLASFAETEDAFETLFDPERYEALRGKGRRRLSQKAFLAALLISLYRDAPVFQLPFRFLTTLVDIDEGFTAWRQRHALLAHRMIGGKTGTGGTSGHAYLEAAAKRHRVFPDLFDLPTFFLPRSELPALPPDVAKQMDFSYHLAGPEAPPGPTR